MSEFATATGPGMSAYAKRYGMALLGMFKPRFLFKALGRTIKRRLFIFLFVAPFIYALAAAWHIYLQAKAGGWNDGVPGELLRPGQYAEAGARWFATAMFVFGIYGFMRGTGFRILKTTYGAVIAAPGGAIFASGIFQRNITASLLYERLLMGGGVAGVLGGIVLLVHPPWHVYLLVASAIALLGALKMARGQKLKVPPGSLQSLGKQSWLFVLGASGGLLASWLSIGLLGVLAVAGSFFLKWKRTHSSGNQGGGGGGGGGVRGVGQLGNLLLLGLMLSGFLGSTASLLADDGGWDEYDDPQGKTVGGYLRTPDGQKVIKIGLVAGGYATAGAALGALLGGLLGDAFGNSLRSQPPVLDGDERGDGDTSPPPLPGQDESEDSANSESPDDSETSETSEGGEGGEEWEVTDDDGKVHVFPNERAANEFYEGLLRKEQQEDAENAEGWYKNAIEQIGFLESVRNGMVRSGRDTTEQDREIAKWKDERNRLANEVRRKGGSTDYTPMDRSDWDFSEEDEMDRRIKEKSDLLRDIHKTGKAARNLANQGVIDYGSGQTENILERVKEWGDNMASGDGKQPTREELDKLQHILRKEMGASDARDKARNSDWVKDGAQMTSREIFTGTKSDGSTSYKSMVLRGLLGAATAGQSEYGMEVAEKMYVVNDEVQKGKSGLDAFKTAATRVLKDEGMGRMFEGGIKIGGKAAGKVGDVAAEGYEHMVKRGHLKGGAIEAASKRAKKVGDFLNQDVGDMMKGGSKQAGDGVGHSAVRGSTDLEGGGPKASEVDMNQRNAAYERGRASGQQKVNQLDDAIQNQKNNPNSRQAQKDFETAVDAVQQDKHAMQEMNRRPQDGTSNKLREGFNKEIKSSYEQAHDTTRQRIADEYGVPVEDVKLLQVTNKPGIDGKIEAADPRGFAKRPEGSLDSHPDAYIQTKPTGEIKASGTKVSIDQDVTYRIRKDNVIDPRTGKAGSGYVDVPRSDVQRVYDQEFYKARHGGNLPEIKNPDGSVKYDSRGGPVIDDAAVHDYSKKMDQACTDRLDAEAYGNGDADLQTAVKGDYKGRDFDDVDSVGKTMEHKQNEWLNDANDHRAGADQLRGDADQLRSKGDIDGADRATRQAEQMEAKAESLTEEGYRQTTKQYKNQLEDRVAAMNQQRGAAGLPPAQIPPKLTEAVEIMKKTGTDGYSPARMEEDLLKIGYTPQKVAQQISANLEALQKFKGSSGGGSGFDFGKSAQGGLAGIKRPMGREIFGDD